MKRKLNRMENALETYLNQIIEQRFPTPESRRQYEKDKVNMRKQIE